MYTRRLLEDNLSYQLHVKRRAGTNTRSSIVVADGIAHHAICTNRKRTGRKIDPIAQIIHLGAQMPLGLVVPGKPMAPGTQKAWTLDLGFTRWDHGGMTEAERAYYDRRAAEYDDWYLGTGLFAQRARPRWAEELTALKRAIASLRFSSCLDVACGTGFLTESLHGLVTGLDQSASMLAIARARIPRGAFVRGDALKMPFRSAQFECLVAGHFYGHLDETARRIFLTEARRVSTSILIIDAAARDDIPPEEHQERVLNDGSRHLVYKRYFTPERLITEIGSGRTLHAGQWFVGVLA